MNDEIESHEFPEVLILETELISIVSSIIQAWISLWHWFTLAILVVVDQSSNS